jgi:hypothetical protein
MFLISLKYFSRYIFRSIGSTFLFLFVIILLIMLWILFFWIVYKVNILYPMPFDVNFFVMASIDEGPIEGSDDEDVDVGDLELERLFAEFCQLTMLLVAVIL